MHKRLFPAVIALLTLSCLPSLAAAAEPKWDDVDEKDLATPTQMLEGCGDTLLPLRWTIEKDEIVTSDTNPAIKLRRIEVKFYTSLLEGRKWGHPSVVFMPADPKAYLAPGRRGKVVVVGQRSWDGLATGPWRSAFLGNYGEPIAASTGYPTMICPVPGEYDNENGREISIGFLNNRGRKTKNLSDSAHVRLAIPYLYAMDVMAGLMKIDRSEIRAVIGGHSKRAPAAFNAAAVIRASVSASDSSFISAPSSSSA